jgi:hypothetical protein
MKLYQIGLGGSVIYPYEVHYVPDDALTPILLAEGDARNGSGSQFSATQALEPQWRYHFERTGTLWFVPFVERLARGEQVDLAGVLEAYRLVHGFDAVMPTSVIPMGS